jgi:hypothetical protein
MKRTLFLGCLLVVFLVSSSGFLAAQGSRRSAHKEEPASQNVGYQWGKLALEATGRDTERFNPRPTVTSRYLGLVFIAVFDAWTRYDKKAIPVYLDSVKRQDADQQTLANKECAISYAAYGSLKEYFYSDTLYSRKLMADLGYDPDNRSLDPKTPEGIGNLAARAVIKARRNDGANQYGEEKGSDNQPYFNYVGYLPINSVEISTDPNRWQPKYFSDGKGGRFAPPCLTPFWNKVKPVGLKSPSQFRPGPPPLVGSPELEKEVRQVVELQATLTEEQKGLIEFMRDGPRSVQQAGHWLSFALDISERDHHSLDEDVAMIFLNQVTAMDAFIACWDSKMFYDYARPYALVHQYFEHDTITAWAGPEKGLIKMKGNDWRPYSPETFLCPPFPGYVSGHSSISGACAEALRLFTGSDHFGRKFEVVAGAMTEPDKPGKLVTLDFPTFTETAEMAGFSRVLGGYHIQSDNVAGLELGRNVAHEVWKFYLRHLGK